MLSFTLMTTLMHVCLPVFLFGTQFVICVLAYLCLLGFGVAGTAWLLNPEYALCRQVYNNPTNPSNPTRTLIIPVSY